MTQNTRCATTGGTLVNTVGSLNYGKDLNGNLVSNWVQWQAAVALLRTPAGHDPSASWANPARWMQVEQTLAATDPTSEIDGNPNATSAR
jgi:hypothetical protein